MAKSSIVLIALAVTTGTALAQPGATEPTPAPAPITIKEGGGVEVDVDALIAKAAAEAPSVETVVRGTVRRARRAISIGPTVGLWSAAFIQPGDVDAALTFGLGVETWKVPVMPSMETVQALVVERAKAQLKDRIKAQLQGKEPEPVELDRMAKEVYEDVRKEILGLENVRPKTMERPSLTVALEANRLFGAERWLGRARVGIGIWKFTLGLSGTFGRVCRGDTGCDDIHGWIGPEVIVHFLMSKSPRASVVDVFLRSDYQANGRSTRADDDIVLGVRYLLDVI